MIMEVEENQEGEVPVKWACFMKQGVLKNIKSCWEIR